MVCIAVDAILTDGSVAKQYHQVTYQLEILFTKKLTN